MGRKNQRYSFETKKEVVTRYLNGEDPVQLAAEYHLKSDMLIHKWAKKWQARGDMGLGPSAEGETELERLQRENYYLRMERDVLRALKVLRENQPDGNQG